MRDISDPTYVAELVEFAESAANELEGVRLRLFDLANGVAKAALHELVDLSDELMVLFRKLTNLEEEVVELIDARPVPAVVEFEEVDR
jgi:hypothetical protein